MKTTKVADMDENFCSVGIYLYGDSILLDDASKLLGIQPTQSRNRGDIRVTSSGSKVVQKVGFWEYRIRISPDRLLPRVVDIFSKIRCAKVVGEAGIDKAELDIFIPLDAKADTDGVSFELPFDLLGKLSRLGFGVVVTSQLAE